MLSRHGSLRKLTIAGAQEVFYPTQARVKGERLFVWSEQVLRPVVVRFGWGKSPMPQPNLSNGAGLPASPFRTYNWPVPMQG